MTVAAYLLTYERDADGNPYTVETAVALLKKTRPVVSPNADQYQRIVEYAAKLAEGQKGAL